MSTYVLIHGAWHGAWCWYRVVPRLEAAGHTVIAPDLAGLGRDKTPLASVSLASWAQDVCALLNAAREPVILVGHSRGGIVISTVAEARPDRVQCLVYLTAFLAPNGQSLFQLADQAAGSLVTPNIVTAPDEVSMTVRDEAIAPAFYGECSEEDLALARLMLLPEPVRPCATPVQVSDARFGRVPRVYIECLRDRAIPPALQKKMYTEVPCRKVLSIDTDHSPFFSRAQELTEHLLTVPTIT